MNTTPPLLTDEQINKLIPADDCWRYEVGHDEARSFARAIESFNRAPLLAEIERLTARVKAFEDALGDVMPADFKDWHQNSPKEWPQVAAGVITNQRKHIEWEVAAVGRVTAELDEARAALAAQAQAEPVAIQGYKCISSAGAVLFTEFEDAASEMQRQGWNVIELVAAPKD